MKVLVISDSHGNIANLKHVMGFAKKIKAGVVLHCGDWDSKIAVQTVLSYKIHVYSVLGNADIGPRMGKTLMDECKKFDRTFLEFELRGKKIGVVHNIRNLEVGSMGIDIIFFGHWQKQKDTFWSGIRAVNPGALENDVNFAIYDTVSGEVEFIND